MTTNHDRDTFAAALVAVWGPAGFATRADQLFAEEAIGCALFPAVATLEERQAAVNALLLRAVAVDEAAKALEADAAKVLLPPEPCDALDEAVLDAASGYGSSVNNDGPAAQVRYLLEAGWSVDDINHTIMQDMP